MARGRILLPRRRVHMGPRRIRRQYLSPRGHQGARLVGLARLRGHHRLLPDRRAGPPCRGRGHRSSRRAPGDRRWCRAAGARRGGDGARRRPLAAPRRVCLHGAWLCHDVGDRPQRDDRAVVRETSGPGSRDGAHGRERWRDGRGAPRRAVDRASRVLRHDHRRRRHRRHHARAARFRGAPPPRPAELGVGQDRAALPEASGGPGRLLHSPGQARRASAERNPGCMAGGRDRPRRAPRPPAPRLGRRPDRSEASRQPSSPPRRSPSW